MQDKEIIFDYFATGYSKETGFYGSPSERKMLSKMTKQEIIIVINNRHRDITQSHPNSGFQKRYNEDIRILTDRLIEIKKESIRPL